MNGIEWAQNVKLVQSYAAVTLESGRAHLETHNGTRYLVEPTPGASAVCEGLLGQRPRIGRRGQTTEAAFHAVNTTRPVLDTHGR